MNRMIKTLVSLGILLAVPRVVAMNGVCHDVFPADVTHEEKVNLNIKEIIIKLPGQVDLEVPEPKISNSEQTCWRLETYNNNKQTIFNFYSNLVNSIYYTGEQQRKLSIVDALNECKKVNNTSTEFSAEKQFKIRMGVEGPRIVDVHNWEILQKNKEDTKALLIDFVLPKNSHFELQKVRSICEDMLSPQKNEKVRHESYCLKNDTVEWILKAKELVVTEKHNDVEIEIKEQKESLQQKEENSILNEIKIEEKQPYSSNNAPTKEEKKEEPKINITQPNKGSSWTSYFAGLFCAGAAYFGIFDYAQKYFPSLTKLAQQQPKMFNALKLTSSLGIGALGYGITKKLTK